MGEQEDFVEEAPRRRKVNWERIGIATIIPLVLAAIAALMILAWSSSRPSPPTANQLRVQAAANLQSLKVADWAVSIDQPEGDLLTGYVWLEGDKSARSADGSRISSKLYFKEVSTGAWVFGCKLTNGTVVSIREEWLNQRYWSANPGCPDGLVAPTPHR